MKVKVKVPATSANLGPGFDVAGVALTMFNTFTFELMEKGLEITGCPQQFCNENNLTYQAFKKAAKKFNINTDFYALKTYPYDMKLPWDFINVRPGKEFLQKESKHLLIQ